MNNENCKSSEQIDEPLLITVKQACKLMNIGRNTMFELAKIKGFPALILPRKNTNR